MGELVAKNLVDRVFGLARGRGMPWNVHAEWVPGGRLERGRFAAAATTAVAQHPLLSARQGPGDRWLVPDVAPPPVVRFLTARDEEVAGVRDRVVSSAFDLEREPPVRFEVIQAPDGDHVVVVADHALVDGVGIGRTAVSLIAAYAYAGGTGGRLTRDELWREAQAMTAVAPPPDRVRQTMAALRRRTVPAAVRLAPEHVDDSPGQGVAYGRLSAAACGALASVPSGPWTRNDVVVAGFCLAGMRWNRRAGRSPLPFTVGVPLNLRPAGAWFEGVCNATLPWPVRIDTVAGREVPSPAVVLDQVSGQLHRVRSGVYSTDVRALLAHLSASPSLSLRERYALATTTVVSTVPGTDVARAGLPASMVTSDLYGGAPVPPAMGMTFAVIPHGDSWRLSARYLRSRHTAAGAARFLSWVDSAVTELCGLDRTSPARMEVLP